MNTKVEEALKVLDEQHDDYLQAGEYSGEGCWFGHNFAADYAKEYAAARTTLAQHLAQQDATIARMREALNVSQTVLGLSEPDVDNRQHALNLIAALNQEQGK